MDDNRRRTLAENALDGYVSGTDAPQRATAAAVARSGTARRVVLVEGISDQMAVEAAARRLGRDLEAERTVVVPIGGAQAASGFLLRYGPRGANIDVGGLYDIAEEAAFRDGIVSAGLGSPNDRADMERLGFFACVADLEDELIRAIDPTKLEQLLESQGDLSSFRTMQRQPGWRGRAFSEQMHRWLRAGARRHLRYSRLIVEGLGPGEIPEPLRAVLEV